MLKMVFVTSVVLLLAFISSMVYAKEVQEHVYIVPAGDLDKKIIEDIKNRLAENMPMTINVAVNAQEKIAETAYDPSRKQYNAQVLLDNISGRNTILIVNERILIIVDVDLYVPGLNFVFGLADEKKGMCIISLTRLKNEFYNLKADYKLLINRALKEAIHELGHSWGLGHCSDPKCVMYFSNTLSDTDKKKSAFCHDCRNRLHRRLYGAPLYDKPVPGSTVR